MEEEGTYKLHEFNLMFKFNKDIALKKRLLVDERIIKRISKKLLSTK